MGKYKDIQSEGPSQAVPFIPGEDAKDRHARRLEAALRSAHLLSYWCRARGIDLTIKNDGHHWIMVHNLTALCGHFQVEWWPSSAKVAVNKRWKSGIHCHDTAQISKILERMLEKERRKV